MGSETPRRRFTALLVTAVLVLFAQVAWQQREIHALRDHATAVEAGAESRAAELAEKKLGGHRAEVAAATLWLQEFYRSDEGLKRPEGLWDPVTHRLDAEAIGTWVLDVYLNARIAGLSEVDARQRVADAIRGSEEWKRAHTP